jgi:CheY-like chemotaxis protein
MNNPQFPSCNSMKQVYEGKKKILLVDDDNAIRRYIEVILQKANFDVISAEDGLSAMKIASNQIFDAVVADSVMPNMSGIDLCRIIKSNPQKSGLPFIIMSGFEKPENSTQENNFANAYLEKNVDLKDKLISVLSDLLFPKELKNA